LAVLVTGCAKIHEIKMLAVRDQYETLRPASLTPVWKSLTIPACGETIYLEIP